MKVYVLTSDPNVFIVPTFAYLFNKYWDNSIEVKVLGFTGPVGPLPDNFEFISLAERQEGAVSNWSTYLINYFDNIEDRHMVLMIEDHLIARPVDRDLFDIFVNEAQNAVNVGRIGLHFGIQLGRKSEDILNYKNVDGYELIELAQYPKTHNYLGKLTGQPSIWSRDYFLKTIRPGWSPWDWEIRGDKMTYNDGYRVLASRDRWCMRKIEALSGRVLGNDVNLTFLLEDDIEYIKENLLIDFDQKIYTHEDWNTAPELFKDCFGVPWASIGDF